MFRSIWKTDIAMNVGRNKYLIWPAISRLVLFHRQDSKHEDVAEETQDGDDAGEHPIHANRKNEWHIVEKQTCDWKSLL